MVVKLVVDSGLKKMQFYLGQMSVAIPIIGREAREAISENVARRARVILSRRPYTDRRGGRLARGIKVYHKDTTSEVIASAKDDPGVGYKGGQDYAGYVEYGTEPHDQPNNPIFKHGGHPGATGVHYMETALSSEILNANKTIERVLNRRKPS